MPDIYENPLCKRYASRQMQNIFSDDIKFTTWRKLWIALAESQKELGLDITDEQIAEMKANVSNINYTDAAKFEYELRHDVMAHIRAYSVQCPGAAPIIHLGATSSYVGDNTDIIVQHKALLHIKKLLINAIEVLCNFADEYKSLPCLGYTHFQAAQPTTLGKRACLWIQDLCMDLEQLDFIFGNLKLLGCRGTTGTSASFLSLFNGSHEKVKLLEKKIAKKMGFDSIYPVSGQTYSRKVDYNILSVLCGIAQSTVKFSNDIRLLSHLREVFEPFEEKQVGSSAMAYKRNPMRSERIASIGRYMIANTLNPALTASSQWLERSLDDSANRRISIPQAFLAADAVLSLVINIVKGMKVNSKIISMHLNEEIPFMATENILMFCVKKGGDRQELHERIRLHSMEAVKNITENGGKNDLFERILSDKLFPISEEELDSLVKAEDFTGCAKEQAEEFLTSVRTMLNKNRDFLGIEIEIKV